MMIKPCWSYQCYIIQMHIKVHKVSVYFLVNDSSSTLQCHIVMLQLDTAPLSLPPLAAGLIMLLHQQPRSINVQTQPLGVQGDQDSARHIVSYPVSNLLTEDIHMVVPDVVMSMIQAGDHEPTA